MKIDFTNVFANQIGTTHGFKKFELDAFIRKHSHITKEIAQERQAGKLSFLDLPYQNVSRIEKVAHEQSKRFSDFVVLGIGGSALGAKALHTALHPPFYNLLTNLQRKNYPRLFILDNVDPEEISALFNLINPRQTLFNVISKSGGTTETLASFLQAIMVLKGAIGKKYKEHLIITTDREKGHLRKFAQEENIVSFEVPAGVEGRYSVLSPVGLVPAAFTGIKIKKLLAGARQMAEQCINSLPEKNPAYQAALVNFLLDKHKGKHIIVTMPYSFALKDIADWFRQLWAESLGKRYSLDGQEVFTGPTPVNALGVTDQHSQIQLYNEGPNDKLIVFIEVEQFRVYPEERRDKVKIPKVFKNEPAVSRHFVSGLRGKTFNDLMNAEKKGTEISLTKNHRPNYTIKLSRISEETIGGLLYFWELATAYAGKLYNVNAFNQPGVEAGKIATKKILGKKK